jgi:hypothetical protein
MCPVVNQSRNVVFRHLWQLFLEDAFEASQDNKAFPIPIIIDNSELDITRSLFDDGGLETR